MSNTQMDELKKWLNSLFEHYEALKKLNGLTSNDRTLWSGYVSVMDKIVEIEKAEGVRLCQVVSPAVNELPYRGNLPEYQKCLIYMGGRDTGGRCNNCGKQEWEHK